MVSLTLNYLQDDTKVFMMSVCLHENLPSHLCLEIMIFKKQCCGRYSRDTNAVYVSILVSFSWFYCTCCCILNILGAYKHTVNILGKLLHAVKTDKCLHRKQDVLNYIIGQGIRHVNESTVRYDRQYMLNLNLNRGWSQEKGIICSRCLWKASTWCSAHAF